MRSAVALAGAFVLVTGGAVATGAALTAPPLPQARVAEPLPPAPAATEAAPESRTSIEARLQSLPPEGLPTPQLPTGTASSGTLCEQTELTAALAEGDDSAAIAAIGGAEAFRAVVAAGTAPCIRLDDPARVWLVVNKQRPYVPIDAEPAALVVPEGVRSLVQASLRPDAAAALTSLVSAAAQAGAGEIALESAYRSYATQQETYNGHVADRGAEGADLVSARPGFSEHQSGLTVDLVPCDTECGTIDDLAASPQGAWLAEHAWEHGWIVRYTEGRTDVTGYAPEPWHLRYIGADLARAYHDGGWTTLEEFFGLPPAPTYAQ
jgi:D-alanyl-D-alanine carboxypeptidase